MKSIDMQKVVYVSTEKIVPFTIKYGQLENELNNENIVEFKFPKADHDRRIKQITKLGYTVMEWIWTPNELSPVYSQYRGIFSR